VLGVPDNQTQHQKPNGKVHTDTILDLQHKALAFRSVLTTAETEKNTSKLFGVAGEQLGRKF